MSRYSGFILFLVLLGAFALFPRAHSQYCYYWPTYRHDVEHTGYSPSSAPAVPKVEWKVDTGAPICSSAAVVDGRLYIGVACSLQRDVICLNAYTGALIWSQTVGGYICSSPAVECGKVFVGTNWCCWVNDTEVCDGVGSVYCLEANTGDILWYHVFGDVQVYGSPAVVDGRVYIGSGDNNVYCFDAGTGTLIWNTLTDGEVYSSPAVSNGKVYVGVDIANHDNFYCLDANTGNRIWSMETEWGIWSSPAVVDGRVFVGTRDGIVYCLDADSGEELWNYDTEREISSSPAVAYGNVYIGTEIVGGLYCLDAATGDFEWTYPTEGTIGSIHHSSPAVGDGKVYIGSFGGGSECPLDPKYDGKTHCLDANTGGLIWDYPTSPGFSLPYPTKPGYQSSSPVIAYGMVFTAGDYSVYAFSDEFFVIPEPPVIVSVLLMFATLVGVYFVRRPKIRPHEIINAT